MSPIWFLLLLAGGPWGEVASRLDAGDVEGAARLAQEALRERPADAEARYWAGKVAFAKGDYDACQRYAEEAVQLDGGVSRHHVLLGDAYGVKTGKAGLLDKLSLARKTRKAYETAVALDQGNADAHLGLMRFLLRAPSIVGGDAARAAAEAETLAALDPVRGALARAEVLMSRGRKPEADATYRDLVAKHGADASLLLDVAEIQYKNKSFEEAERLYGKVLALHPDDPLSGYRLASIAIEKKANLDQAKSFLEAYLRVDPAPNRPSPSAAHWRLGQVYDLQGDRAKALAEWHEALRLNPGYEPAQNALREAGR